MDLSFRNDSDNYIDIPEAVYDNSIELGLGMSVPPTQVSPPPRTEQITMPKSITKFSGYMHEDPNVFLSEFHSYLVLSNIDVQSPKATAAFHLHLKGPALVWFNTLKLSDKASWYSLNNAFTKEYCENLQSPILIAEEAAFNNLKLMPSQPIEQYHSMILQKGNRLGKPDRDMTFKFIDGLPQQLAFFVRAGRTQSFREALYAAKIGEAHGYRSHSDLKVNAAAVDNSIQSKLDNICERLANIETSRASAHISVAQRTERDRQRNSFDNQRSARGDRRIPHENRECFRCSGQGHLRNDCNWSGMGTTNPTTYCQYCRQNGHDVKQCRKCTNSFSNCQWCNASGHQARDCPQLNEKGLKGKATFQASQ